MSIHTILSQMEMEKKAIDLIIHRQVTGDKLKDDSNILDIFKYLFKAFVTRIVEEVRREERERIIKLQKEVEDKKWIDAEHCSCLAYAIDIIENPDSDRIFLASNKSTGTKLQKMKG